MAISRSPPEPRARNPAPELGSLKLPALPPCSCTLHPPLAMRRKPKPQRNCYHGPFYPATTAALAGGVGLVGVSRSHC